MNYSKGEKVKVAKVVSILKEIDVDGETMQYILEQVGMADQVYKQLDNHNLQHRLIMVLDDLLSIRKVIGGDTVLSEKSNEENFGEASIFTMMNNIEIACDLNDDESDNWGIINKDNLSLDERWEIERSVEVECIEVNRHKKKDEPLKEHEINELKRLMIIAMSTNCISIAKDEYEAYLDNDGYMGFYMTMDEITDKILNGEGSDFQKFLASDYRDDYFHRVHNTCMDWHFMTLAEEEMRKELKEYHKDLVVSK